MILDMSCLALKRLATMLTAIMQEKYFHIGMPRYSHSATQSLVRGGRGLWYLCVLVTTLSQNIEIDWKTWECSLPESSVYPLNEPTHLLTLEGRKELKTMRVM